MKRAPALLASLVLMASATAAMASARPCPEGLHGALTAELFFGGGPEPSPEAHARAWRAFVDKEISPRFPEGLAAGDVYGQRRASDRLIVREPSEAVILVIAGTREERRSLRLIRDAYERQFHQPSALLIEPGACVSF